MRKDSGLAIFGGLSAFAGMVFLLSGYFGSDISVYSPIGAGGSRAEPPESDGFAMILGIMALAIGAFFIKESGYLNSDRD